MKHQLCENNATSLRDGRSCTLRPLTTADRRALLAFGRALPSDHDPADMDAWHHPEVIDWLLEATTLGNWRQIIATSGDIVVGYGVALRLPGGPERTAEIYAIVSRGWRHAGLDAAMAMQLLDIARDLGADRAVVDLSADQQNDRLLFERLGFRAEGTINAHLYAPKRSATTMFELELADN